MRAKHLFDSSYIRVLELKQARNRAYPVDVTGLPEVAVYPRPEIR